MGESAMRDMCKTLRCSHAILNYLVLVIDQLMSSEIIICMALHSNSYAVYEDNTDAPNYYSKNSYIPKIFNRKLIEGFPYTNRCVTHTHNYQLHHTPVDVYCSQLKLSLMNTSSYAHAIIHIFTKKQIDK